MICYRGGVFSVVVTCCSSFAGVVSNLLPDDMLSRHGSDLVAWTAHGDLLVSALPADDDMLLSSP